MLFRRLIAEVQAFVDSKELNEMDAEWIQNLSPDSQLASALKCMKVEPNYFPHRDMTRDHRQKQDTRGPYGGLPNGG